MLAPESHCGYCYGWPSFFWVVVVSCCLFYAVCPCCLLNMYVTEPSLLYSMPLWLLLPLFLPVSALAVSAVRQDIIMGLCRPLHMIGRLYNTVRGLGDFVTVRCRRYATAATKAAATVVSLLPDRQSFIFILWNAPSSTLTAAAAAAAAKA